MSLSSVSLSSSLKAQFTDRCGKLDIVPPEVLLHIVKYLGPIHSTCLGLTCRRFYELHALKWDRVNLLVSEVAYGLGGPVCYSSTIMADFLFWSMSCAGLVWNHACYRYTSPGRFEEMMKRLENGGREDRCRCIRRERL